MNITFNSDGNGLELQVTLRWRSLKAVIRAVVSLIAILVATWSVIAAFTY